jgi:hypothetical protein
MCSQGEVLSVIVSNAGPLDLDAILRAVAPELPPSHVQKERKNIVRALGKLMRSKLAERVSPVNAGLQNSGPAIYDATAKGRALIAAGGKITSGPKGPHTGIRKGQQGEARSRLWHALRIKKRATIAQLIRVAAKPGEDRATLGDNARAYLKAMTRAGVVVKLKGRVKETGSAPSSNGNLRYALLNDLGPLAPVAGRKFLINPNRLSEGSDAARIPYRENNTKKEAKS